MHIHVYSDEMFTSHQLADDTMKGVGRAITTESPRPSFSPLAARERAVFCVENFLPASYNLS